MPDDDEDPRCPFCEKHDEAEALVTEGIILTTIEAILKGEGETVSDLASTYTPYDAHVAASMIALLLCDLADVTGASPLYWVERERNRVMRALGASVED